MRLLKVLVFIGIISVGEFQRISLNAYPSRFARNGSRLHLVCELNVENRFDIFWKHNNTAVGEQCMQYKKSVMPIICKKNKMKVEWIIDPISYAARGSWSCSHGSEIASVDVVVDVPQKLKALKFEFLHGNNEKPLVPSSSAMTVDPVTIGTGTRSNPINLIGARSIGIQSLILECLSNCASNTRELVWSSVNKTSIQKHSSFKHGTDTNNDCEDGLQSERSRALVTCASSYNRQSKPSKSELNPSTDADLNISAVGLNIIYCSTEHPKLPRSTGDFSCLDGFSDANSAFACVHVLCDGPQPPLLTGGEQAAIVLSAFLIICMIIVVCIIAMHARNFDKSYRGAYYPGGCRSRQDGQIELIL